MNLKENIIRILSGGPRKRSAIAHHLGINLDKDFFDTISHLEKSNKIKTYGINVNYNDPTYATYGTPNEKQRYDIVVEAMVPMTIRYRVNAENEEEALKLMQRTNPSDTKPKFGMRKITKATIYQAGTTLIKYTKNYK